MKILKSVLYIVYHENYGSNVRNNSGIKDEICSCYSTTIQWCATLCRKQLSGAPLTLLRFYSVGPRHQPGEMDTLQIHLFGNLNISIIVVAANLLHLFQIQKNYQSNVQNFAYDRQNMIVTNKKIYKIHFLTFYYIFYFFFLLLLFIIFNFFVPIFSDFVKSVLLTITS